MCRGISFCVLVRPGCKSHFSYSASVGDLSLKHKSCAHSTVAFGLALLPCPAPLGAPCPGWWVDQLPPAQAQAGMGSSGPIGPPLLQLLAPYWILGMWSAVLGLQAHLSGWHPALPPPVVHCPS